MFANGKPHHKHPSSRATQQPIHHGPGALPYRNLYGKRDNETCRLPMLASLSLQRGQHLARRPGSLLDGTRAWVSSPKSERHVVSSCQVRTKSFEFFELTLQHQDVTYKATISF